MSIPRKVTLIVALALALLTPAAGAAVSASAQPVASHIHVVADTTPNTPVCGGGGSGFC